MDSQSSRQVVRQSTEEEEEKDDPFKVGNERITDRVGVETVLEDGGRHVGETRENDDT